MLVTLRTLCLCGFLFLCLEGVPKPLERFEYARIEMGTRFRIVLYAEQEERARQASQTAFARIEELDRLLSDYRDDSELNRVSLQAFDAPQVASPELFGLLEESIRLSRLTGGAFDVTVRPLVELWREARQTNRLPDPEKLARARGKVGYRNLLLNSRTRSVRFARAGLQIDLGAIAKGFAADQALEALQSCGIERALIDAGGDILVGQPPPGKAGWTVSLKVRKGEYRDYLLANQSIATSGDEFQYAQIGGHRYSHIVDPRSGQALTDSRLVTVIARDAATADAWATALSVLDLERGRELIKGLNEVSARIALSSGEVLTFE